MVLQVFLALSVLAPWQAPPVEPQAPAEQVAEPVDEPTTEELSLDSLRTLQRSLQSKRAGLLQLREELSQAATPEERSELAARIQTLQLEVDKAAANFESVATGVDVETFDLEPPSKFNLQDEVLKLIRPLVEELKDATEAPRQIERLRGDLSYLQERERQALEALERVEGLIVVLPTDDEHLRAELEESRLAWQQRVEDIEGQRTVTRFQLEKRLSESQSILKSTQAALADFFRTRGFNLVLALATFFLMLVLLRALYRVVSRRLVSRGGEGRPLYARLIDVLYFVFAGGFALAASLLVLYVAGDWVLLGLTLLFLLGVVWASKTAIPMFLEQIRLLLNLGTVRERERLVVDGVPYRVSKLAFYTLLSNPELAGGVRRLPIQDLAGMRSRICSKDEIWFPSKRGDWVRLSDGVMGMVIHQSPDMVQLEQLGGARITYPTADFMAQGPKNMSGGYRRQVRFGIDYSHQAISTTEVPDILLAEVGRGLRDAVGEDGLHALKVEFCEAGASSLDYMVIADLDGSTAPRYEAIGRLVQRLCVDICNREGWGIPFTQITVHQAASPPA